MCVTLLSSVTKHNEQSESLEKSETFEQSETLEDMGADAELPDILFE